MNRSKKSLALSFLLTFTTNNGFAKTPTTTEVFNYSLQMTEAFLAWPLHQGSKEVVIAIIDTGVDTIHPNLQENLWQNPGETGFDEQGRNKASNGVDDDGNGYIDDVHGWNFAGNNHDLRDLHGHGTHVAGIIQSITPKTNLMILKYYDPKASGAENLTNTVKAIEYAVKMNAKIINYSGGGTTKYPDEEVALRKAQSKGILFVAAAGNEKSNSDINGFYPADYGYSNIISVTAIDENRRVLPSSNYGTHTVDIAAPGNNIVSTLPGGKFGTMTGTSQATAFVTGTAALLMAQNSELKDPEKLIQQLTISGNDNDFLIGKTKYQTTLNTYRSLIMKDTNQGAFGSITTNHPSQSFLEFSDQLNPELTDTGTEELPFKNLVKADKLH
jgi:subtilisin family serine protease